MNDVAQFAVTQPPLVAFNPYDWYWYVAGDTTRAYSSKLGDYVPSSDATFQTWQTRLGNVATGIESEVSIGNLLVPYVPNVTLTSTVLVIQQALRQAQLDLLLVDNADVVKLVQAGQSTTLTGPGLSGFLATSTNNYRTLRSQIATATTPVQVRAVPINSGWPSNP